MAFFVRWLIILIIIMAGIWKVSGMPGRSWSGPLSPLSSEEARLRDRLRQHVTILAGDIGERNVWHADALNAAAGYIEHHLRDSGLRVASQPFRSQSLTVRNIEAELPGYASPGEIVVVGAHYDSVSGCPGANDNASGVAALLELARLLADFPLPRTVRLVAFVNEEPPFFYSGEMGSRRYATRSRDRGDQIMAMVSLETIGYYTNHPGSQRYPFPFNLFYPDTGNFIGFVGNLASRHLLKTAVGSFRRSSYFPSEGAVAPGWMTGVHWSDHWSFWQEGYPAIMVTDTALFRYKHYHSPADTPERLDYPDMARVVSGLVRVIAEIAGADAGGDSPDIGSLL